LHKQHEPTVDELTALIEDLSIGCDAGLQRRATANVTACQQLHPWPASPHDRNCAAAWGRSGRRNSVVYLGNMTRRRSGSTPVDSVRTYWLSASARWMIFRSDGNIGSSVCGFFSRMQRSKVVSAKFFN